MSKNTDRSITSRLRKINNLLSIVAIALGLYIAGEPFLPQILYLIRDRSPAAIAPYGSLAGQNGNNDPQPIPDENRLVIPSISLNQPVKEGDNIWVIHDGGTWRLPQASTPDKKSNTVIVGHRYYASESSTFYNLDKVKTGEEMAVYWDKKEYIYRVREIKVVPPTAVEVEAPSDKPILTLYTCHPIWTSRNRLVVISDLVSIDGKDPNAKPDKPDENNTGSRTGH